MSIACATEVEQPAQPMQSHAQGPDWPAISSEWQAQTKSPKAPPSMSITANRDDTNLCLQEFTATECMRTFSFVNLGASLFTSFADFLR